VLRRVWLNERQSQAAILKDIVNNVFEHVESSPNVACACNICLGKALHQSNL
jgi:hypothetical protein